MFRAKIDIAERGDNGVTGLHEFDNIVPSLISYADTRQTHLVTSADATFQSETSGNIRKRSGGESWNKTMAADQKKDRQGKGVLS
jgi:hypothetical protein